jgi:hypothetical protein
MSKQDKKLRQYFRREYQVKADALAESHFKMMEKSLKPRPKWIPEWIWLRLLSKFIKIDWKK